MHIQSAPISNSAVHARPIAMTAVAAEPLWAEHGWGLSGRHVALLVGAILIVSLVLRAIG